ncbi:MAG: cation diffusion facilitator family transporter [Thalassolituus sp.]|jgi:cobalt-zinc-cadmium efflux system protein|uniref:Cation efflux family protein n=1 Tax=Thalassolituus oleivorans MIL-1 TaxID=1298593 RepID=M5DNH5_9GAMM|nr:cation diffusion facilitator family transporter [Thalassolituus oleivorans]AHK15905.1 cobalt transporter [Thalassolituus oleivorans R6-15]APR68181.1 cation transporter [Thalassolituus oleivorans]PCI46883.1 MAG: cation transporter [Oceanospirillales bacterium]CCU70991.1 cation efflux family protein [Thalassolituus oleivorans MIL-1]
MHQHSHDDSSKRMGLAFWLNLIFTVIEFVGGWLTNSTAIMADAVHDLGDSLSIGSAWLLNRLGRKSANPEYTYGYRRLSLFGALINGLVLIAGSVWVLVTAIPRLADPVMPHTEGMLALAVLGVAVNGYAAYRLSQGKTLNEKVLNWHLLEDVLGWVAVLIVATVMQFVDWPILDPLLSIGFTLFILINVLRNLWATGRLFFQAVPEPDLLESVRASLMSLKEIDDVHHLHLWSLDGEHHVLTAHVKAVQTQDLARYAQLKATIQSALETYDLAHTTIEIELAEEACRDQPVSSQMDPH